MENSYHIKTVNCELDTTIFVILLSNLKLVKLIHQRLVERTGYNLTVNCALTKWVFL